MTGMTDHIARTQATLERCVAARQWQNVAAIGGFKSEHDARVKYDTAYMSPFETPQICLEADEDRRSLTPGRLNQVRPRDRRSDETIWQDNTRRRIMALGIPSNTLSEMMGFDRTYLSGLLVHGVRRSQHVYTRIDAFLDTLEKNVKPVPIKTGATRRSGASSLEWRQMVIDRLAALQMGRVAFAKYLRMSRSTFRACMADSGYLSQTCRFRIEDGLACLEATAASQPIHAEAIR